jgi:hypothetical protein
MAYSPIGNLPLGQFLQIAFTQGVFNQLNQTFPDFEMVKKFRVGDPNWREQRFLLQTSLGPAAVQYRNPNFSQKFPNAQRIGVGEKVAVAKEIDATVEIEYNLYKKALNSPLKYAEPLALEMQSKAIAAKRRIAADLYGDGSGVLGTVASVAVVSGKLEVTLSALSTARGHIGFFEYDDLVVFATEGGVAQTVLPATVVSFRVVSRSRKTDKVVLEGLNANGVPVAITGADLVSSGDLIYRAGQETIPNITAALANPLTTDWGSLTEVFAGLETLLADDGRVNMSGATAGTVVDGGGSGGLSLSLVQEGMSNAKVAVGQGIYKWSMLVASPERRDDLIESAETDRRFMVADNPKRGGKSFVFQHENDTLEVIASEYCSKQRAYALPNQSAGRQAMMQLYFTEMSPVDVGGGKLHLKPAQGGGHERKIASYMEGNISLLCTHPAAGVVIKNF